MAQYQKTDTKNMSNVNHKKTSIRLKIPITYWILFIKYRNQKIA